MDDRPCQPGPDRTCATHGNPGVYFSFEVEAHPLEYGKTGRRSFYMDESSIIRGADIQGKPGHAKLPEL